MDKVACPFEQVGFELALTLLQVEWSTDRATPQHSESRQKTRPNYKNDMKNCFKDDKQ